MMDQSDSNMVTNERSSSSASKKPKSQRVPMCTRCQNHGLKIAVKFHKRDCQHRYCICDKCIFTSQRQHFMKVSTAARRARQQYEEKMQMQQAQKKKVMSESSISNSNDSNSSDTPPIPLNNNSNHSSNSDISKSTTGSSSVTGEPVMKVWRKDLPPSIPPLYPPTLTPHTSPLSTMLFEAESNIEQVEALLKYSEKLLDRFGYPLGSLNKLLMYVILKDARADAEAASRRIIIDSMVGSLLTTVKTLMI